MDVSRTRGVRTESRAVHVVHKRARVHERDEDGVGQVKEKDDGEFE